MNNLYLYYNLREKGHPILFVYEGKSRVEADKAFGEQSIGLSESTCWYVGIEKYHDTALVGQL